MAVSGFRESDTSKSGDDYTSHSAEGSRTVTVAIK